MVSYRDVYVVLRARDEASRTIARVGGNFGTLGRQMERANRQLAATNARIAQDIERSNRRTDAALQRSADSFRSRGEQMARAHRAQVRSMESQWHQLSRGVAESNAKNTHAMAQNRVQIDRIKNSLNDLSKTEQKQAQARIRQLRTENIRLAEQNAERNKTLAADRTRHQEQMRMTKRAHDDAVTKSKSQHAAAQKNIRNTQQANQRYYAAMQQNAQREHEQVQQAIQARQQLGQKVAASGAAVMGMGLMMTAAGVKGVAAFNSSAQAAAEFERQARVTYTQLDNIPGSLDDIKKMARDVGSEIGAPFDQMQETLYSIFTALDVSVPEAEELLRGFAKEAVAGQTDIQEVARSSIAILNAYGMGVEDLTRIQDMQFQTIRKGRITYEDLSTNIGKVIPAAAGAGQEIEMIGASMAFLTRNGLSASMAATSAARGFEVFGSALTVSKMEEMGIQVKDASGEYRAINEVFGELAQKLEGMPGPERTAVLHNLMSGGGSANIQARRFWNMAIKNFDEFQQHVEWQIGNAGAFENAYKIMAESPSTQLQLLTNQWEILSTEIGDEVLPLKIELTKRMLELVQGFRDLDPETKQGIVRFAALAAVILAVAGPILLISGFFILLVGSLMAVFKTITAVIAVLVVTPVAIMALIAGLVLLILHWDRVVEYVTNAVQSFQELARANPIISGVAAAAAALGAVLAFIFVKPYAFLQAFITGLISVQSVMAAIGSFFSSVGAIIASVISTIVGWVGNLIGTWNGVFTAVRLVFMLIMTNPVVIVIAAIIAAIVMMIRHWDSIKPIVMAVWEAIKNGASAVVDWLSRVFGPVWDWIKNAAITAWNAIRDAFLAVVNRITGFVTRIWDAVRNGGNEVTSFISSVLNSSWFQAITAPLRGLINVITSTVVPTFRFLWNVISTVFKAAWEIIKWFGNTFKVIAEIIAALIRVTLIVTFHLLRQVWQTVWEAVSNVLQSAWRRIKRVWDILMIVIRGTLIPLWEEMQQRWEIAWARMRARLEYTWAKIRYYWNLLKLYIDHILGPYFRKIREIWDNVWSFIRDKLDWAWTRIRILWEILKVYVNRVLIPLWRNMRQLWSDIWDAIRNKLRDIWNNNIKPIWEAIKRFAENTLFPLFRTIRERWVEAWERIASSISGIWERIRGGIANGVNSALSTIESFINNIARGINNLIERLNKFPGVDISGRVSEISLTRVSHSMSRNELRTGAGGRMGSMHSGGEIGGFPGKETPILAQAGEGVVRASAMQKLGKDGLDAINRGRVRSVVPDAKRASETHETGQGVFSRIRDWGLDKISKASDWLEEKVFDKISNAVSGKLFNTSGMSEVGQAIIGTGKSLFGRVVKSIKDSVQEFFGGGEIGGKGTVGGGIGWARMWGMLKKAIPFARLTSAVRPGARTRGSGRLSYHARGRAIDIAGRGFKNFADMGRIASWIASNHGRRTRELIYSPFNSRQIINGRNRNITNPITRADHWDHVHWAMKNGGRVLRTGRYLVGEAGREIAKTRGGISEVDSPHIMNLNRGDSVATTGGANDIAKAIRDTIEDAIGQRPVEQHFEINGVDADAEDIADDIMWRMKTSGRR